MDYTYKKIKNFATRLSKELGLQMHIHKEGKTLVCFLSESLDLYSFAWVDINIGTYDKWMQDYHMSGEILGGGDWYALSDFSEDTQAMVRDARRKGEPVVWIEMAVRTIRHERHETRFALIKGSEWACGDDDFNYIKEWLEERRANVASEDVAALKIVNSRRGLEPHYHEQSKTIIVEKNYKYGLLDMQGEIICEPLYDDIHPLKNGNVIVCKENSWSLINRQGEILKRLEYDKIECFVDGCAVATLGGKYGIIDESGNLLGKLKYDKIMQLEYFSKYKYAEYFEACVDSKWGFLNKQGKEMSPFVYDETQMRDFEGGFVRVCKNGKWGYVNDKCEEICPLIYDEVRFFQFGRAAVCREGLWGFINEQGEEVVPCVFDEKIIPLTKNLPEPEWKSALVDDYLNKIGEYALLTAEEEQELLTRAVVGDKEAQKMIVHANRRFIVSVSNQYQNRGLSLLELFDISTQGLVNAAMENASKPHDKRFIQFAVPYMRKAIEKAISGHKE